MATMASVRAAGLLALVVLIGGCAGAPTAGGPAAAPAAEAVPTASAGTAVAGPEKAASGYKYVCNCGPTCNCDTTADKPGNCTCGKPMAYRKVIREDSSYYWVCSGGTDEVSKDDLFKCTDGKPLHGIQKKGRYACACQNCDCGYSSQTGGVCVCGKPLKAAP